MALADEIRSYLRDEVGAKVGGKGDKGEARITIAERKSLLAKKTVEYSAKFKVEEPERAVRFFEMLKESGSGMSTGDGEVGAGWGVSKQAYKSTAGGLEGGIEAQGSLLGNRYSFTFDYGRIRTGVQEIVERNGYLFSYQVTPKGM